MKVKELFNNIDILSKSAFDGFVDLQISTVAIGIVILFLFVWINHKEDKNENEYY